MGKARRFEMQARACDDCGHVGVLLVAPRSRAATDWLLCVSCAAARGYNPDGLVVLQDVAPVG